MRSERLPRTLIAIAIALLCGLSSAVAQELEPRAYRALPKGLQFVLFAYGFSTGNVLVDPTAPVEGIDLDLNIVTAGYARTFSLFGRSSIAGVRLPYVLASGEGTLNGELIRGSRNAPADARIRMTHSLVGGPALSPAEFAQRPPRRTFGVGLTVSMPTGQYNSKKVVNFGANRWGFKPEVGYSGQRGRWITDMALGAWLFTKNDDGPGGLTKRQDPIGSFQIHLSYNFSNGMWLSADGNYFIGGQTSIDGMDARDLQRNSRIGVTLSIPLGRRDSIKLAANTGAYTRAGADFDSAIVAYQRRVGGAKSAPTSGEEEE